MIIKNHFHKKGFALGLILKQRLAASWKWPICIILCFSHFDPVCAVFMVQNPTPDAMLYVYNHK